MRSGTHLAMDMIFNSLMEYRRKPLYLNLDGLMRRGVDLAHLQGAGYVIKTHHPTGGKVADDPALVALIQESVVLVVRRSRADIRRSLERWVLADPDIRRFRVQLENIDAKIEAFEEFWQRFSPYRIDYEDIFDRQRCQTIINDIASLTGHPKSPRRPPSVPVSHRSLMYTNKVLTRLLGRYAPRIDTTIRARH